MNDIYTRVIKLPCRINAMVNEDENGDYNIYINEALSEERKWDALFHELRHIKNDDFHNDKPIMECENIAKNSKKLSQKHILKARELLCQKQEEMAREK